MFSLCNRFIRETLSGNAEGYKVFCIQLDKSRFVEMEYTTDRRFSEDAL